MTQAPERIWVTGYDRDPTGRWWHDKALGGSSIATEYVRADLAQAPAPVRVKALEWIAIDDDDCEVEAYAAGFRYWVFKSGTEEFTLFLNAWEKGHYPTLEAAKAAAQADYEARVLAALEAPDAGVVAELVEALRMALNYIANTEGELGVELDSGNALRAVLARVGVR